MKSFRVLVLLVVAVTGCSVFPGLRVLTGSEDANDTLLTSEIVELSDLVMADKTGSTDPSLMAAADRIENAATNVDIIEIRRVDAEDTFVVNMLFIPPQDANTQTQQGAVALYTSIQRAIELSWQGTMRESEGLGALRVSLIFPREIPTLDNSGLSFIGLIQAHTEIERADAVAYLAGPRRLADFLDLIANGTLEYIAPEGGELYEGQPNHPMFILN